jgi:hypothetical protein
MYVHFMDVVHGLLIPVAQPTVRVRRLQDLGFIPLLAGSFGPCLDLSSCTYVLRVGYTLC